MNKEYINSNLNPIIFDTQNNCYEEICEKLLLIAEQATHKLDPKLKIDDVLIVGSIANYNWNENSDIDLHIVIDFKDISDDLDLVEKYLKLFKDSWNQEHTIIIRDIEVEISFQDVDATPTSNGQYSVKNKKWKKFPIKISPGESTIKKAIKLFGKIRNSIDQIEKKYRNGNIDAIKTYYYCKKIWNIVKLLRGSNLKREGEFGHTNIAFKELRNSGYIEKLENLKLESHDKIFSLSSNS